MLFFNPGREVEYLVGVDLFSHLLALQRPFFLKRKVGELVSMATNDTMSIRLLIGFAGLQVCNVAVAVPLHLGQMLLTRAALAADLPILGVCRGMQVLTVAAGGTLHQHLPDVLGHEKHRPAPAVYGTHDARFTPGSRIEALMGDDIAIHCYHHQGVADPGTLTVTGRAEDGLPEAVEDPAHRFVLGVQWHPELNRDRRLFGALVNAAAA